MATQREMYHGNELYAWRENAANRTRAIDVDKWAQNQADILHLPGAQGEKKLSILDNVISPSSAFVRVDTEGGAPADDLAAITPGDLHAGMLLHLVAADSERVVTLRNSADATGIQTVDGKDVALDTQYGIVLRLVSTEALTYWEEIPGPLRAKKQPVASKDNLGLMQVGQHLEVTPEGVVDVPVASESMQGIGRSATTAEVKSGITGEKGPAWVTPEALKPFLVKTGFVLPFAGNSTPEGYVLCNGAAVSRTTYAALFAVIGTLYGTGDGSTTFNLPNSTDKVIQGSGTAGTEIEAGLPELSGTLENSFKNNIEFVFNEASGPFSFIKQRTPAYVSRIDGGSSEQRPFKIQFNASNANYIYGNSSTVQPSAITMRYYIKY